MSAPIILGKDVRARYATVAPGVQEIFSSDETYEKIQILAEELALPPSIRAVLGKEIGYAILDLRKPEETMAVFLEEGAGPELAEATIKRIANDILVEVEATRREAAVIATPPVPSGTLVEESSDITKEIVTPAPKPFVPPVSIPQPLAAVPAYTPAPPRIVVPAPVPPSVPPPAPIPVSLPPVPEAPRPVAVPEPTPVPPPQPARPRTMASDVEALQNPGETPMRAPVPTPHPAPAPQPVAQAPAPKAIPQPPKPVTPVPNASAVHEDLKKYGVDPYREPVE